MKMPNPIHIIVADDHKLFAEGIIALLSATQKDWELTHINNGELLINTLSKLNPQLILLDIKMPGLDGIACLEFIKKNAPKIKVIMLSTFSDTATINKCMHWGADAFLLKNVGIQELESVIQKTLSNKKTKSIGSNVDEAATDQYAFFSQAYKLTRREWDVIQLIKKGHSNQQISDILNLSIYTTETHRKNIMQKLKLKTPVALMKFIMENEV